MTKRRSATGRYVKTGSFNRLAGRSVAPGSEFPEHFFLKRRIIWIAVAAAALLPGVAALLG